jgi:hypothetical protein
MAMSLRSTVKRSNAASIALFSVLLSTTRKFFWESGGCVTCYWDSQSECQHGHEDSIRRRLQVAVQLQCPNSSTKACLGGKHALTSSPITARNWRSLYCAAGAAILQDKWRGKLPQLPCSCHHRLCVHGAPAVVMGRRPGV